MVRSNFFSFQRVSDIERRTKRQIGELQPVIMSHGSNENFVRRQETNHHATTDDFCRCFNENLNSLHQLAFLLTRNQESARQCFVGGLEDCAKANNVFREWARTWAMRAIIQNAIRALRPHPDSASTSLSATVQLASVRTHIRNRHHEIDRVLVLDDFERFVFVMSVLVHYSDHDCALLLSSSLREIREARARAFQQISGSSQSCSAREILQETK
jgi:hypothetical protein